MGPPEWDYSHLCRQDTGSRSSWLETHGYSYDVLSDTDLHMDASVLDGRKVLFVVGHSEYWSFEAMGAVSRFLDRGGSAIVLSGNTAFWRVSFSADGTIMECRKGDAPGTQVRADRRGEMWHSHDGRRGGMSRECGFPAWRLFGLEYFSLVGAGAPGVGPFKVRNPEQFLFREPIDLKLRAGDLFLENRLETASRSRSVTKATYGSRRWRSFWWRPRRTGQRSRVRIPAASRCLPTGWRIGPRCRSVRRGITSQPPGGQLRGPPPIPVAARMIYWERPGQRYVSQRLDQFKAQPWPTTRSGAGFWKTS